MESGKREDMSQVIQGSRGESRRIQAMESWCLRRLSVDEV
jgi:hypothetical protein